MSDEIDGLRRTVVHQATLLRMSDEVRQGYERTIERQQAALTRQAEAMEKLDAHAAKIGEALTFVRNWLAALRDRSGEGNEVVVTADDADNLAEVLVGLVRR